MPLHFHRGLIQKAFRRVEQPFVPHPERNREVEGALIQSFLARRAVRAGRHGLAAGQVYQVEILTLVSIAVKAELLFIS